MIRLLPALLALLLVTACARPVTPVARAQAFWDAVAAGDRDAAAEFLVAGDRTRQLAVLAALDVQQGSVEVLQVPPEAEVAMLPTTIVRNGTERWTYDTTTVLRRSGDLWYVDLEGTREELRSASVDAVGDRLSAAARRLGDAFAREAPELGRAIEQFGRDLSARIDEEGARGSEALADEVGRRLEQAGEALTEGLEQLERALEDMTPEEGRAAPRSKGQEETP
ncbi:MAG TPA: hypothetical protein VLA56_04965 [Pseudomonadales bacterium]|nr:hypothetical protein [Pseudomonadales bacterium]